MMSVEQAFEWKDNGVIYTGKNKGLGVRIDTEQKDKVKNKKLILDWVDSISWNQVFVQERIPN